MRLRYAIDWKALRAQRVKAGEVKCLGRFPKRLIKQKLQQLLEEHCRAALLNGVRGTGFQITPRWWTNWQREFGLSLRKPNRKYSVPREVMGERLMLNWVSVFAIRALAVEALGYDLDMENFDQTPYHQNEIGSQDRSTVAVKGGIVPLVEAHAATRSRWSANLTTFSDKGRILGGELPYAQLMFKAEGDRLRLRLREYVRGRGHGPWLSVATSDSASYKTPDILAFLEQHLPLWSKTRRWRILFADDFGPHKNEAVRRLCWARGYVMKIFGGGCTGVAQTCDTYLNQHVRREYSAIEGKLLIEQMRRGVPVPCLKPEDCIDTMAQALNSQALHLNAAQGYKRTGLNVDLDGTEDCEICREAATFWAELRVREKVDAEVRHVREEARNENLSWTYQDVYRLVRPYPKRREYDDIIARIHDDEVPELEGDPIDAGSDDEEAQEGNDSDAETCTDDEIMPEEGSAHGAAAAAGPSAVAVRPEAPPLTLVASEEFHRSNDIVVILGQSIDALVGVGLMASVQYLQNEVKKERRRQRNMSREDPALAAAWLADRDREQARLRKEDEALRQMRSIKTQRQKAIEDVAIAKAEVRKRRLELLDMERLLECKRDVKRFTPAWLGEGDPKANGVAGRKRRMDVLDRISRHGSGLSAAQANDFAWFKEAWDARMVEEHKDRWGSTFASWTAAVLEDIEHGTSNAFSLFVHNETRRCFGDEPALCV